MFARDDTLNNDIALAELAPEDNPQPDEVRGSDENISVWLGAAIILKDYPDRPRLYRERLTRRGFFCCEILGGGAVRGAGGDACT